MNTPAPIPKTRLFRLGGLALLISVGTWWTYYSGWAEQYNLIERTSTFFTALDPEIRTLIFYILVTVLVVLLISITCSPENRRGSLHNSTGFNFIQRMEPKQYEYHKKIETLKAIKELRKSPEFRKNRKDLKEGKPKPLAELGDEDEYFSDEQVEDGDED